MWGQTERQWETFSTEASGAALCRIQEKFDEPPEFSPAPENEPEAVQPELQAVPAEGVAPAPAAEAGESGLTDDQLVVLSLQGQTEAFGELIQRHYSSCLKRATFMIRNRSEAEDEVQNACWKAFQHLGQYRGEGTFSAWLGRIVENQCLMRIREERKSQFVYLDEASESNVRLELVGQMPNPEDELGEQQVVSLVRREICLIPPLLRTVMMLRDVQQLPMPEVAAQLGLSVPAAKSRLMRARAELRQRVAKHCGPKGCGTLTQRSKYKQAAYCRAS
jgi:RNA polymerase sigma-70 factor (ECF subfamily)